MQIQRFYERCMKNFADSLEEFKLYHFNPYYETSSQKMMLDILTNLKEMGKMAELIVDFDENKSFDCVKDIYFKDGLLHITGNIDNEFKEKLILKPEEMLIRCRKYNISGNFVFIRNADLKNYEENFIEEKERIILEESDMNVLIHAKGSKFTDSNESYLLMRFLRRKNKR